MARVIGTSTATIKQREVPQVGGWLTVPQTRKRKGIVSNTGLDAPFLSDARPDRYLSDAEMWSVYRRTPDVRACIDSVVRRVATFDWTVRPTIDPNSEYYLEAVDIAARAQRFLMAPNKNGDTWQDVMTSVLTDLLVFDAGVIELARDSRGVLQELVPLCGSTIVPITDDHGRLIEYQQETIGAGSGGVVEENNRPVFKPSGLVMFQLFPNTSSGGFGNPLIESIVNEIITLLRAAEHLMLAYDADEIPPGILVLTGLAGNAAREARSDFQNLKGQDSKIRVLTTPDPTGAGARWVELRRTPKDLEFQTLIDQIRRVVWRVFGVMPVEMGASDEMPRATAQVQIDVSSSHLVTPVLEMIQAKINARILPLVVGDSELSQLVTFEFDRGMRPNAEEAQLLAQKYQRLVGIGVMTRNEVRKEIGLLPIFNGDVPTVDTAQGPIPLDVLVTEGPVGGLIIEPPDIVPDAGPITAGPIEDDNPPGEVEASDIGDCGHDHMHERGFASFEQDLPSEWQPDGRFKDYRTIDLNALGWSTINYKLAVVPFWKEARDQCAAVIAAHLRFDLTIKDFIELAKAIDKLVDQWSIVSRPLYREAAQIARDAVVQYAGQDLFDQWEARADIYADEAIHYLKYPEGMLGVMKTELMLLVDGLTRSIDGSSIETRTDPKQPNITTPKGIELGIEAKTAVKITTKVFDRNEFRIGNWSGKLVALANELMREGIIAAGTATGENVRIEWYYEWVSVGDNRTCPTCIVEGNGGFRPLSTMGIRPGSGTVCGARCRCVIVLWTKPEVDSGTAVSLSPVD